MRVRRRAEGGLRYRAAVELHPETGRELTFIARGHLHDEIVRMLSIVQFPAALTRLARRE